MIVLIDNYDSFTWNLYHYLGELGAETVVHRNDKVSVGQVLSSKPRAIVLSPGPCTPNQAGICLELIKAAADTTPILGVCLGHQAIGQAFGGKVVRADRLMHGKLSTIMHNGAGIFADVPNEFQGTRYHSLVVDPDTLPECLEITARTGDTIMGLEHKSRPVYGVQFHPESIASQHGHKLLKNFLSLADTN
jgi:anthranilate synthase component II